LPYALPRRKNKKPSALEGFSMYLLGFCF
jgi:hypothetical protein